jgi:hypothetical protein
MLLLLLLAVDFGRLFSSYIAVNNAAREATNYASARAGDGSFNATEYHNAVVAAAEREINAQTQGGAGTLTVSGPDCFVPSTSAPIDCRLASTSIATGIGNQVTVSVDQPFTFLTPLVGELFGGQLTMTASATGAVLNPADVTILGGSAIPTASPSPSPSPTPSPTPTATPTFDPGATPAPTSTASPSPTPTPIPTCRVPQYRHTFWNNVGGQTAIQVWHGAGFTGVLTDNTGGKKIHNQTLAALSIVTCTSNMAVG